MTSAIPSSSKPSIPNPKPPDLINPAISYAAKVNYADKVSFAAALATPKLKPRFNDIPLPNRQYGTMEGEPAISFSSSEFEAGARCYQFSLIAKFTMGRPTIDTIRQHFQSNWDIKGRATISEIWDGRHLLVILDSEADMVAALTCPLRKIQHAMFRLFRYTSDYNPRVESTTTTKWIRLPGLPPPFFHRAYIGAIVNSFAYFLDTDERTKACASMRYARACIECDVTVPIPGRVWVGLPDNKGFWQNIVLEGNISYCSHCKIHGHELLNCRKKKPSSNAEQGPFSDHKHQQDMKDKGPDRSTKQNISTNNYQNRKKGKGKIDTEWKIVESKKTAKREVLNMGYGPDLLYANTDKIDVSPIHTSKSEYINQKRPEESTSGNKKGDIEEVNETGPINRIKIEETRDTGMHTCPVREEEKQTYIQDSQLIKTGFAMLTSVEKGDINSKYSEEEIKKVKEDMVKMMQRMDRLKDNQDNVTKNSTTCSKEDSHDSAPIQSNEF